MAGLRIRWRGVARAAAIVAVGLIALRLVPILLRAPEPPPLGRDVGLPRAGRAAAIVQPPRRAVEGRRKSAPQSRPSLHAAPAATAVIGIRTPRHLHHRSPPAHKPGTRATPSPAPKPPPEPVERTPPPAPEYVPPPAPEPAPAPTPAPLPSPPSAPRSVPGDGSEEFAPH